MAKQLIITLLILSFSFAANAQKRKPYRTDRPAVSITNECKEISQHIWWGVDNRFRIIVEGANCDSLSITSEYFNFEYLGDCYYNVTVKDTSYKGWLDVYIRTDTLTINTIWHWSFLHKPQASITIGHGYDFLIHKQVQADYFNYGYSQLYRSCYHSNGRKIGFIILSYSVEIIRGDSSMGKFNSEGPQIFKLKKELGIVKSGDKLVFTNVMVKGPDGIVREAYGFEYLVE